MLLGTVFKTSLSGANIQVGVGDNADSKIILKGIRRRVVERQGKKSDMVVWQKDSGSGSTVETLSLPLFLGQGSPIFGGPVLAQIPEGNLKHQVVVLSQQPGMPYLQSLSQLSSTQWQPVKLAFDQWSYSQQGLTPAGAALVAVAVAVATQGAGAQMMGISSKTTMGAMANAAVASLAAQASITLINNGGNIGQTLRDLASSSTAKAAIAAALTAGLLDKIGGLDSLQGLKNGTALSDKFAMNLINAGGRALTHTAITGGKLEDAFKAGLIGALVDTVHGEAASSIKGLNTNYFTHKLLHAIAGCGAGAAVGGSCRDGAIGAAVGEIVAELMKPADGVMYTNEEKTKVLAYSKLIAGGVAAYAGGNAQTAITTAETAVTNNALFIPLIIGAAWLVDKGMTAYELYQDIAAVRDGSKTVEELALQKSDEYITAVFLGNAGKYGLKILKVGGKWISGKSDDLTNVMESRASHGSSGGNAAVTILDVQQKRHAELAQIFDPSNPRNGITMGNKSLLPRPDQAVPIYDGVSSDQVKTYFMQLAGTDKLPTPTTIRGRTGGENLYVVQTAAGAFTLRDFATSSNESGPVWTIEFPRNIAPNANTSRKTLEVKFSRR